MRTSRSFALVVALGLLACQAGPVGTRKPLVKATDSPGPAVVTASTPAATPSSTKPAGPTVVELLLPPKGDSVALSGTIAIDASYVVATGGAAT